MTIRDVYKDFFPKMFGVLRRRGRQHHDAEDLVQEAFTRLLMYMHEGRAVERPEALLMTTALNLSVDTQRRARQHLYEERPIEELVLPSSAPSPEDEVARTQLLRSSRQKLDEAVGRRARDVFWLKCFDGLTYHEISRQLNISTATVERDFAKAVWALSLAKPQGPKPARDPEDSNRET